MKIYKQLILKSMLTRLLRPTTFAYNKVPKALVKTNNTLLSINKT